MQGLWLISVKHYDLIVKECKEIGGVEGASKKKELTLYQKKRAYSCI